MKLIPHWIAELTAAKTAAPDWLSEYQTEQRDAFLAQGIPSRKMENWKYADLTGLKNTHFTKLACEEKEIEINTLAAYRLADTIQLVFINGHFAPHLSDLSELPSEVIACSLQTAIEKHPQLVKQYALSSFDASKYPFASLNAIESEAGLFLHLAENCVLAKPIHLLSLVTHAQTFIAQPKHTIILGKHSQLTLFEEYIGLVNQPYLMNIVTNVYAQEGSVFDHSKMQHENTSAIHLSHTFVNQLADSQFNFANFSKGSAFARDELSVNLKASGAQCSTAGFYLLSQDNQFVDHHVNIHHLAPRSLSDMFYKGVLDKQSRAVFNGRLYVEKDAQKILAHQANHNLLLSSGSEMYSKPELEIYADDVKCKHGASTGQLDEEALFYLCSRGIDKQAAQQILLQGFAEEVFQRVKHSALRAHIQEKMAS